MQPGKWSAPWGLVVIEACDLLPPRDQGLAVIEGVVNLEMGDEPCGLRPASVSRRTEGLAWTCNGKAAVPDMMITVPMENRWKLGRRAGRARVAITEAGQGHSTKPQQSGTRLRHSASRGHTRTSFLSFRGTRRDPARRIAGSARQLGLGLS